MSAPLPKPKLSTDPRIKLEIDGKKGWYVLRTAQGEADLTFFIASDHLWISDQIGVPDEMDEMGAGLKLATRLVEDARANGARIILLCPFVDAQRCKHTDWTDVFQT
ncbi:MAG: N-acetyltransferase [Dinoroseobacter sp.]|nr:N-acetyltransferase [Dinoroseobacter sp.]